jgi:hypothetical protein
MAMTEVKLTAVDILGFSHRRVPIESLRSRPRGHLPSGGGAQSCGFSAFVLVPRNPTARMSDVSVFRRKNRKVQRTSSAYLTGSLKSLSLSAKWRVAPDAAVRLSRRLDI